MQHSETGRSESPRTVEVGVDHTSIGRGRDEQGLSSGEGRAERGRLGVGKRHVGVAVEDDTGGKQGMVQELVRPQVKDTGGIHD